MDKNDECWANGRNWGVYKTEEYAQVLFKRATGELPEMESSKAAAKILSNWVERDDAVLDVGCGVGHYLRSLKNHISCHFSYTGVDNSAYYIELAKKAFLGTEGTDFNRGDIYQLPFEPKSFDVVMSNNVFLHLPSIGGPLKEICRLSRKYVLIRTLVSERSFRIQEIRSLGDEFNEDGTPKSYNFYNIYSKAYIEYLLSSIDDVRKWEITKDNDFNPEFITESAEQSELKNVTKMINEWQVNGCILQPWSFIKIFL